VVFLKCAIPVFDGLLPEPHNSAILRLLFICVHWHGLAKLRMHTDQTLEIMDHMTTEMGAEFRLFRNKTCTAFSTQELPRETAARKRRWGKGASMTPSAKAAKEPSVSLPKQFNLQTYKYHSLGDYADTIRRFGTLDSFSTELVSDPCYIRVDLR
jgi:hypothetical protein